MNRKVVVTGMGIITAHGIGREKNWSEIRAGISAIKEITSFDTAGYRGCIGGEIAECTIAHFNNLQGKRLDRATHMLVCAAREALSDNNMIDIPILLSLGTTLGGMLSGEAYHREVIEKGLNRARLSPLFDYFAHYQAINLLKELQLTGDFLVFSNACASGVNAIGHAFNSIRRGDYDIAVCGGYDTMSEFTFSGFNSLMAVTPSLCRPFDKNRDGLVLGEGAGILVLEDLDRAAKRDARILGEIAGYGESSDAYHMTGPEPSGRAAAIAIEKAWIDAGKPIVDYINAHGTGTKYNDAMETNALMAAFGKKAVQIPVSSTKPMMGHLLGGAGAVEAIISLLSITHNILPPTLNYETPDPQCALNIVTAPMECEVKTVLSNSFGFGGSNAALIVRECP